MSKKERGRPMCSHHVRIVPEYRDTPDMEKLGKALISVAVTIAGKKRAEQPSSELDNPTRSASSPADTTGRRAA